MLLVEPAGGTLCSWDFAQVQRYICSSVFLVITRPPFFETGNDLKGKLSQKKLKATTYQKKTVWPKAMENATIYPTKNRT